MNTHHFGHLVGGWSCFAFSIGLFTAYFSHSLKKSQDPKIPSITQAKVSAVLSACMILLAFVIGFIVMAGSKAYSGPIPAEVRDTWGYDKDFAALIALAFAVVFAFDSLRLRRSKK
jgi:hypothetical protein